MRPPEERTFGLFAGGSHPGAGDAPPAGTLRVSALAGRIQAALRQTFPRRLWVVGEAAELERNIQRKHWFFRLCENNPEDGKRYALGAVLWAGDARRLFGRGGTLDGVIEPRDGIEIRALCDVDFYPPNGDLRLIVRDIDAAYTLGRIALDRQQLIERLGKEGVLERQQRLVLAPLPLRIGLITSGASAAYSDFVNELLAPGLAFTVRFFDARMQGEETVPTVLEGLRRLAVETVDVIALVRGGGSTVDLAWFDREEIVRAIAASPVPVLTGIGHEIDTSVSDLAAHASFKTPTAVAAFLAERGHEALRFLAESALALEQAARRTLVAEEALERAAARLLRVTATVVREGRLRLMEQVREARRLVPRALSESGRGLGDLQSRFSGVALRAVEVPSREVLVLAARLRAGPLRVVFGQELRQLASWRLRLARTGTNCLRNGAEALAAAHDRVRLLDPAGVVRRGFAILRNEAGRVIKDAAAVQGGDRIVAELRDGEFAARVERTGEKTSEGPDDGRKKDAQRGGTTGRGSRQLEIW